MECDRVAAERFDLVDRRGHAGGSPLGAPAPATESDSVERRGVRACLERRDENEGG